MSRRFILPLVLFLCASLLLSSCGGTAEDEGSDDPGDFNYIPLNDQACQIDSAPPTVTKTANTTISTLLNKSQNFVNTELEICSSPSGNSCPACTNDVNRMGGLLDNFSGPLTSYLKTLGVDFADSAANLKNYFKAALSFPLRYATFSLQNCVTSTAPAISSAGKVACPAGMHVRIVMTQAKRQPMKGKLVGSSHYTVEAESLDKTCTAFPLMFYGKLAVNSDNIVEQKLTVNATLPAQAVADKMSFGFYVPFIEQMPPDAASMTDDQLNDYLLEKARLENGLQVKVFEPTLTFNISIKKQNNLVSGCGQLSGYVNSQIFVDMAAGEDATLANVFAKDVLPKYEDATHKGQIFTVLSMEVNDGSFTSGMPCTPNGCDRVGSLCEGDILNQNYTYRNCTLPFPDGISSFVDGTAGKPTCSGQEIVKWSIDCSEITDRGTCKNNTSCSVTAVDPKAGDVILSEIYYDADKTDQAWIELTNVSGAPIKLNGCYIQSRPKGAMGGKVTLRGDGPILIGTRYPFVVARDAQEGFDADFLTNPPGDVYFRMANELAFRLTCNGTIIDEVNWSKWTITPGTSLQLSKTKHTAADNDIESNWCLSTVDYIRNKNGTPQRANVACP